MRWRSDERVVIELQGGEQLEYEVYRSFNMSDWILLQTGVRHDDALTIGEPKGRLFYRAPATRRLYRSGRWVGDS